MAVHDNARLQRLQRWKSGFEATVKKWEDRGFFTIDNILASLTTCIKEKLGEDELDYFDSSFTSFCSNSSDQSSSNWDESAFTKFLGQTFPASFLPFQEAAPILFRSIVHCAGLPFNIPSQATRDGLLRAIIIQIPSRNPMSHGGQMGSWLLSRKWSVDDERRLLFRSIATRIPISEPTAKTLGELNLDVAHLRDTVEPASQKTSMHAKDILNNTANSISEDDDGLPEDDFFLDVSAEEPGVSELLDTLAVIQPDRLPGIAEVPRTQFRNVAALLPYSQPSLDLLAIPKGEWFQMLKLLLTMRVGLGPSPFTARFVGQNAEVESVGQCMLNAFIDTSNGEICWKTWDEIMAKSFPYILSPLGHLYNCFFHKSNDYPIHHRTYLPNPGDILTISRMSQIATFMSEWFPWHRLEQVFSKRSTIGHTEEIFDTIIERAGPAILLISGYERASVAGLSSFHEREESLKPIIFGAYISNPWSDDFSVRVNGDNSILFQLSPTHDVFRSNNDYGGYVKKTDLGKLNIGNGQNVSLTLDCKSISGKFERPLTRGGDQRKDEPSILRSDFDIQFIEVWALDHAD